MRNYIESSKFISLILRHQPEVIDIRLDENGWANVSELLVGMNRNGHIIDMVVLEEIVATNNKKRFVFNEDKTKIRANQGHSIQVNLELQPAVPPDTLFHGTADRFLSSIQTHGLQRQGRNHVHLSSNRDTAVSVGRRHGKPVVLNIDAKSMVRDDYIFYISENGVWLTSDIPVQYINIDREEQSQ